MRPFRVSGTVLFSFSLCRRALPPSLSLAHARALFFFACMHPCYLCVLFSRSLLCPACVCCLVPIRIVFLCLSECLLHVSLCVPLCTCAPLRPRAHVLLCLSICSCARVPVCMRSLTSACSSRSHS